MKEIKTTDKLTITDELSILVSKTNETDLFRVSSGSDTAKSEIAIGKILEIYNKGISDTTCILPNTPTYREGVLERKTKLIERVYREHVKSANQNMIVLGSSHLLGLYLARVTNSLFLPLQLLTFIHDWNELKQITTPSVAGFDYDADPLIYVWLKPDNMPEAYRAMLEKANDIILVRSTNMENQFSFGNHHLHYSVLSDIPFKSPRLNIFNQPNQNPDWEFGLSDQVVHNVGEYCKNNNKRLLVIEAETSLLNLSISSFVQTFYEKNQVVPKRFVFNSYWISHPYYEIESFSIPICTYKTMTKDNLEFISRLQIRTGIVDADVFINDFGGDNISDLENYFLKSGYFNVKGHSIGADNWDNPHSSSRYISQNIKNIKAHKWNFLSLDEILSAYKKIF